MIPEKYKKYISISPDCWLWVGRVTHEGYGRLSGKLAHRLIYEAMVGPINDGLALDHLCRVRNCVNPLHLEPVTNAENNRRSGAHKTECKSEHKFDGKNTYITPGGKRQCRACNLLSVAKYQQKSGRRK